MSLLTARQKIIIWAAVAALAVVCLWVPWTGYTIEASVRREMHERYAFLFNPPRPANERWGVTVDVPRVVIPASLIVFAAVTGVLSAARRPRPSSAPAPTREVKAAEGH
jgi:hypothetical protein